MTETYQNFRHLVSGFNVHPAVAELEGKPELWNLVDVRQRYAGSAHADTETIFLRGPNSLEDVFNNLECMDYAVIHQLPAVLALLRAIASRYRVRDIGRVMLVRLKADGFIRPHTDEGDYARFYARLHLPLVTNETCTFSCGNEIVQMKAGELWWFNHQRQHSVANYGADRIHLIMDISAPGFTGALADIAPVA
ncbi:MAG TPA: aspartyl/asparaginyl beta-hydroxylase domain-containing protein [Steroidobacteraceae bacterium]|jgi:hypothetical protein